jgi:hypothetical protein
MEKVKPKAKKKDMDKLSKALRENMRRRKKAGGRAKGET